MKLRVITYSLVLSFLVCLSIGSCKKKQEKSEPVVATPAPPKACEPSYINVIKPIMQSKCAVSGCHVTNFPFGDYTTYSQLKTRIDNGKIKKLVFENNLMPPASSTQLTQAELETIKCWMDNGALEN